MKVANKARLIKMGMMLLIQLATKSGNELFFRKFSLL